MLDSFLETLHTKTKKAKAQEQLESLLERLPRDVLQKIASGEIQLEKTADCGNTWLEQFRGTPLLDEAIAIEQQELEIQAEEMHRRQMESELRASLPSWEEADLKRQQLCLRRKMLELELIGGSSEDLEAGSGNDDLISEEAPEEQEVAEEQSLEPPKAETEDKPKTKITTGEKETEPKEKIDIKAAAAKMRGALEKKANSGLLYPALAAGTGTVGYFRGKAMADRDESFNPLLNAAAGTLLPVPGALPYVIGKSIGYYGEQDRKTEQAKKDLAKEASAVTPASGFRRQMQLLTGSRARALEAQAGARKVTGMRQHGSSEAFSRSGVFDESLSDTVAGQHMNRGARLGIRSNRNLHAGNRAARAAAAEREAVGQARRTALQTAGAGMGGLAVGAAGSQMKTASRVQQVQNYVANMMETAARTPSARKAVRAAPPASAVRNVSPEAMASTVRAAPKSAPAGVPRATPSSDASRPSPFLSTKAKLLGGAAGMGVLGGAGLAHHKQASTMVKNAFGAAVLSGLKGMAGFAGTAGKSVANAARAGGVGPAMQAAGNAGRAGMMRAGNFITQNPGAGAAMVAAPALAAGYAAGRQ